MYNYVHTHSTGLVITRNKIDMDLIDPYIDRHLYSLINGLKQSNFGYNTVDKMAKDLTELYKGLSSYNKQLYIDSGGYSIIVGDVHSRDIRKFIDCYNYFLQNYAIGNCDKIFSLDIPIFLDEKLNNTCENIYDCNIKSSYYSKQILDDNPELYDKFTWVLHFKIEKQFNIWRKVYDQFYADEKRLKNFAIGGLVGLRGITNIKFSPFIIPIFKLLKIIRDKNLDYNSVIHILGVYGFHDRFMMYFMDKLFNNYYLNDKQCSVDITFDTINYTISGFYNVRNLPCLIPLDENCTKYKRGACIDMIDDLKTIISNEQAYDFVKYELTNINNDTNVDNVTSLALLFAIYNQYVDKIMHQCIDKECLVEKFIECNGNNNKFNTKYLIKLVNKWEKQYPYIFKGILKKLQANFMWLSSMHVAWNNGAKDDMNRIDNGIIKFSKAINFPFDLIGDFKY
jgi:hypothetical protein